MSFRQKMTLMVSHFPITYSAYLTLSQFFQQKLKSTAIVSTCATGVFIGLNIYKSNERFYDKWLMPFIHLFDPESCHRLAVLACKYRLFPKEKDNDPKSLVSVLLIFFFNSMTIFQRLNAVDQIFWAYLKQSVRDSSRL